MHLNVVQDRSHVLGIENKLLLALNSRETLFNPYFNLVPSKLITGLQGQTY